MLSTTRPPGYELVIDEYLFNTEKHRLTQSPDGWHSFYWVDEKRKVVTAFWHLHVDEECAFSPFRATFSGPQFTSKVSLRQLVSFITCVHDQLTNLGVKKFLVTLPPQGYDNYSFVLAYQAFVDAGFVPIKSEAVAIIPVGDMAFENLIHSSEKKKINKCKKRGYTFKKVFFSEFERLYSFIEECRAERGHQLSLPMKELEAIIKKQPNSFSYFCVQDNTKYVAAAICIHINDEILYVFYGGHLKEYDKVSPAVYLYKGIYEVCQLQNIRMIDFGTSPKNGATNYDLLDFKTYLGSELSLKVTFSKS